jgi:Fe-S-cluster formation regulator IscX/YfhJ
VSSDSDFTALANRIREQGLDVIGIGEAKAPESLRNVCNRFILIENIVEEAVPAERGTPGTKLQPKEAVPLILKAMDKIAQDDEWYELGQIGQYIAADSPDFDPRTYGKRKLSDLIMELRRFETKREGHHLYVRRVD